MWQTDESRIAYDGAELGVPRVAVMCGSDAYAVKSSQSEVGLKKATGFRVGKRRKEKSGIRT